MKPQELKLSSEVLNEFRDNLDAALQMMVKQLVRRDLQQGTLNAKIDVTIKEETTQEGEVVWTLKVEPDVGIKIGAKGRLECREQNGLFMKMDRDGKPVVGSCQMDIDELLKEEST